MTTHVVPPVPLRVASVPSGHPYVQHLASPSRPDGVLRLPDPAVPGAPAGQWWPSPVLDPAWLRAHAAEFDLVHVHFGTEHLSAAELVEVVRTLRDLHRPLVLTVHDLAHPHLSDPARHDAALDVLVPAAAAVLTLTAGAAAEIRVRWGREAHVVPHPHVLPLDRLDRPRETHEGFVVGLQAKPRANNAPELVRAELAAAVAALPGGRLAPELAARLSDEDLWEHLAGLDVLVLAYRWSTHSGFVEACADLGTTVLAPRTGHLAEQHGAVLGYDLGVPSSLTAALRQAHARPRPAPLGRAQRTAQREEVAATHAHVYRAALGRAA